MRHKKKLLLSFLYKNNAMPNCVITLATNLNIEYVVDPRPPPPPKKKKKKT